MPLLQLRPWNTPSAISSCVELRKSFFEHVVAIVKEYLMADGEFLAHMYHLTSPENLPMDMGSDLNLTIWLRVNNTVHFVITRFSISESNTITEGPGRKTFPLFQETAILNVKKQMGDRYLQKPSRHKQDYSFRPVSGETNRTRRGSMCPTMKMSYQES